MLFFVNCKTIHDCSVTLNILAPDPRIPHWHFNNSTSFKHSRILLPPDDTAQPGTLLIAVTLFHKGPDVRLMPWHRQLLVINK